MIKAGIERGFQAWGPRGNFGRRNKRGPIVIVIGTLILHALYGGSTPHLFQVQLNTWKGFCRSHLRKIEGT